LVGATYTANATGHDPPISHSTSQDNYRRRLVYMLHTRTTST